MMNKFKWNLVPQTDDGFVFYKAIPSPVVRKMVAQSEKIKLEEEINARKKWVLSQPNKARLRALKKQWRYINTLLIDLENAGTG